MENDIFISVVGFKHYHGSSVFKEGMKITLKKEPDNIYDKEAILVEIPGYGICGYVSNSPSTTLRGTKRASRIYDTFDVFCEGKVVYSNGEGVICVINPSLLKKEKNYLKGENLSVYLEKIEDERYAFSILYDDNSETKVQISIPSEKKKVLIFNSIFKKDFEMTFSEKLNMKCYFENGVKVHFNLIGNINAFAEVFFTDSDNFKKFLDL